MSDRQFGIKSHDGLSILRAKSGDRYFVRLFIGDKLIDVYFAAHLEPLTAVDASPDAPNPPNWDQEYNDFEGSGGPMPMCAECGERHATNEAHGARCRHGSRWNDCWMCVSGRDRHG